MKRRLMFKLTRRVGRNMHSPHRTLCSRVLRCRASPDGICRASWPRTNRRRMPGPVASARVEQEQTQTHRPRPLVASAGAHFTRRVFVAYTVRGMAPCRWARYRIAYAACCCVYGDCGIIRTHLSSPVHTLRSSRLTRVVRTCAHRTTLNNLHSCTLHVLSSARASRTSIERTNAACQDDIPSPI